MTELTGPKNCAECGSQFTREIIEAGGSRPATVTIRKHLIPIPGLYTCAGCDEAIRMGVRQSGITYESARAYLDDVYGPAMIAHVMLNGPHAAEAAECTREAAEVSVMLELVIYLQGEPGGLDFIPECTGNCGKDHAPHPRDMASMN